MTPLLFWVGGKRVLAPTLAEVWRSGRYKRLVEPFCGAANLFFEVTPSRSTLVDTCGPLIAFYAMVKGHPRMLIRAWEALLGSLKRHDEAAYYNVRDAFNEVAGAKLLKASAAEAAAFLYLNRAGFQGMYRVNSANRFNVPYGHRKKLWLPEAADIMAASAALKNTRLVNADFGVAFKSVKAGDFVYVDPPFYSTFDGYSVKAFTHEDHERLSEACAKAREGGATVVVSNSDTPQVRKLYPSKRWSRFSVNVQRIAPQNGGRLPEIVMVGV